MILIRTNRNSVHTAMRWFRYINLQKRTRLNDLGARRITDDDYLSAVVINCLLADVEKILLKKLVNTTDAKVKLQFSDAEAVVLYKTLLHMPIDPENMDQQMIRNDWIQQLDQGIINQKIYAANRPGAAPDAAVSMSDYYDY